jgi:HrpA-like RNA helicase
MLDMTVPEIKRVNLSSTILTLKNIGIKDVINFDYLDRPDLVNIHFALKQLYYLQAIDKRGELEDLGVELSKFPLEPTFAKALLSSHLLGCEGELSTLVSVLSSENVWMTVSRKREERSYSKLEDVKKRFASKTDGKSDHMILVSLYDEWSR